MRLTPSRSIGHTALLASLIAVCTAAPAIAGKPVASGAIAVKAGYHLHMTSISLGGCDQLAAGLVLPDNTPVASLGDNSSAGSCNPVSFSDYDYQNTSPATLTVLVQLVDNSTSGNTYNSDGSGRADHATATRTQISINDSHGADVDQTYEAAIGQGNLNVTYKVSRR